MKTIVGKTSQLKTDKKVISYAAKLICTGEVVAFPTETVYGLGANALSKSAVKKIFEAKGRPSDNPLIVHISELSSVEKLAKEIPDFAYSLMKKFWPGPLTIILKKQNVVPDITTAGRDTVGIRMPAHNVALQLIHEAGCPIAAPSANSFGKPSPTLAKHVSEDLDGKIPYIVDGGSCKVGVESTIVDLTSEIPLILRPGGVTIEDIEKCIGKVNLHKTVLDPKTKVDVAHAPGMKYKHYSPKAKVVLIENGCVEDALVHHRDEFIALITLDESPIDDDINLVFLEPDIKSLTKNMFKYFRDCDEKNIDTIIVDRISKKGLGISLLNRVKKAATKII